MSLFTEQDCAFSAVFIVVILNRKEIEFRWRLLMGGRDGNHAVCRFWKHIRFPVVGCLCATESEPDTVDETGSLARAEITDLRAPTINLGAAHAAGGSTACD
jgi:hypothetical protein